MIPTIIWLILLFIWLGYESDWFRVELPIVPSQELSCTWLPGLWINTFAEIGFFFNYRESFDKTWLADMPTGFGERPKQGYEILTHTQNLILSNHYHIRLSAGIEPICGRQWLNRHWADLEDYHPQVELYFGNGYRQTFTLRKPELMKEIIKINTGKKYFKELMEVK